MPPRIKQVCRVRGCSTLTDEASGYCESHKHNGWVRHQGGRSRHQRGYGKEWESRRAEVLKRDRGLCQECLSKGRVTPATTVDHIIPRVQGGTDEDGNLRSLCKSCHASKTAREGRRG
ncbi:HNH endonuclease [Aeromonas diversa]|uniref:HNH endonuclease n=1 Tax=Aeromonas diversa TaxID=502790 RepID=UPI003462C94C